MVSTDLRLAIADMDAMSVTLHVKEFELFAANGYKGFDGYNDFGDLGGELAIHIRESTIIADSLEIQQDSLKDPRMDKETKELVERRHAADEAKGKRQINKAGKLIKKGEALLTRFKNWKPENPRPIRREDPAPAKPEKKAPAPKPPKPTTIKSAPVKKSGNLIDDVFKGQVNRYKLPEGYYKATAKELTGAVKNGMGKVKGFEDLYESLNLNAQAFAGAKTYNLVSELEALAKTSGKYSDYEPLAKALVKKYDTWGEAEVNTAQQQTHQAKQWKIIEEDSELFPILEYSTIGDACKICAPLDKMRAPFNSPIWAKVYPCNHYSCYCIVKQLTKGYDLTDKKEMERLVSESEGIMSPVFLSNPGQTGVIYTKNHPYFTSIPTEDRKFAKENFGLPIK